MRIVAGTARGRRLASPEGETVRPTGDRVREAIFNALHSEGAVLDLFAGTGALGIEALSRGAKSAVFVERLSSNADCIQKNLSICGLHEKGKVVIGDVNEWLVSNSGPWDLVLMDPPYAFAEWVMLLGMINAKIAVIESDRQPEVTLNWHIGRVRRYGGTVVTVLFSEPGYSERSLL